MWFWWWQSCVVGAVTLSGVALTPIFISTIKNPSNDTLLENKFTWHHTQIDGIISFNNDAMLNWINIIIPYLELTKSSSEDELRL